ncbi:hypothetical protein Bca4012_012981 [Brassica carinata]|uniref:Uncharacterized protein n=1 Tax=Brassica carinata TaxID=52824 RepID=A0A8X7TK07_BRACI|nr:hypothetical protein Bca52824_094199 [Brassica carinata]
MEGLIPFLYKAIVMYKRERSLSLVLFSDHESPSTDGYYMRLPGDSSADFGPSALRQFGSERHEMLETKLSSTS